MGGGLFYVGGNGRRGGESISFNGWVNGRVYFYVARIPASERTSDRTGRDWQCPSTPGISVMCSYLYAKNRIVFTNANIHGFHHQP